MTDAEDQEAVRRGYWLKRAREHAGITQGDAAITAGLGAGSGSTVSLWERGLRPIKVHQMKRLALRYGVSPTLFIDPPLTDTERLAQAIADAVELEREDSSSGEEPHRQGGGGPNGPRRIRQA